MSFDRSNPNHCPTCDTTEPCVHRATRSAHVAFREGRDAFNIPWSNGVPIDKIDRTCMYAEGTDDATWWHRGFQGESRQAVALERRSMVIAMAKRVGYLLGCDEVIAGSHIVEAKIDGRWWQYAGDGAHGAISDRTWDAPGCVPGWSIWTTSPLTAGELASVGRLVPFELRDHPPLERGDLP